MSEYRLWFRRDIVSILREHAGAVSRCDLRLDDITTAVGRLRQCWHRAREIDLGRGGTTVEGSEALLVVQGVVREWPDRHAEPAAADGPHLDERIRLVDVLLRFFEEEPSAGLTSHVRAWHLGFRLRLRRLREREDAAQRAELSAMSDELDLAETVREDEAWQLTQYVRRWLDFARDLDLGRAVHRRAEIEQELEDTLSDAMLSAYGNGDAWRLVVAERYVVDWTLKRRLCPLQAQLAEGLLSAQPLRRKLCCWAGGAIANFLALQCVLASVLTAVGLVPAPWFAANAANVHGFVLVMTVAYMVMAWPDFGRAWVPRLGAVSVVGYLVLMQFDILTKLNDSSAGNWPAWTSVLSAGLALVYLWCAEVGNHTHLPWHKTLARSTHLLGLGLAQSLAVGFVGYCVVTSHVPPEGILPLPWAWAPMALLIGLVAQALWQREAITEPI